MQTDQSSFRRRQLKAGFNIALIGSVMGVIYPVFADGFGHWLPFVNGFTIGFLGGGAIAYFELVVFDPANRRMPFLVLHFYKVITYLLFFTLLVVLIRGLNESLYFRIGFIEYITGDQFVRFLVHDDFVIIEIYVFTMISLIIFSRQIIRKMGQRTFLNFISGKYHHPRKEHRIFLFMDLKSSTSIAEKLGDLQFHNLMRDFFFDITRSIIFHKGEVYRYVGDEIVVVWETKNGIANANCLRVHFDVKRRIWQKRDTYQKKFNMVPEFRTVINEGEVYAGEIGDVKSQIVYQGEVLYATREMERQSKKESSDLLVALPLMELMDVPNTIQVTPGGIISYGDGERPIRYVTLIEEPDHGDTKLIN